MKRSDATESFLARPIKEAAHCKQISVPTLARNPVSIAPWQDSRYLICNYALLQEIDIETAEVRTLDPPMEVPHWCPTGVWTEPEEKHLFVANYTGHDVLEMRRDAAGLHLVRRFLHAEMRSPENVALSADRRLVGVADYDGNRLWVFGRDGALLWSRSIPMAHGVAFGPDFVVVTSLHERTISKFDLQGNALTSSGSFGWGDEKYLWPTSIFLSGDRLLVADAHTGKIIVLDHNLRQQEWVGGNGPSPALFNMPYSVGGRPGTLLVCDTFNHRILVLDDQFKCRRVLAREAASGRNWVMSDNEPASWLGYRKISDACAAQLPGLPLETWCPGYGRYTLGTESKTRDVRYPMLGSLWSEVFPYFCWCSHFTYQNADYLLLGQSQDRSLLIVDAKGRCQRKDAQQYLWKTSRGLRTSDGASFDPTPFVKDAAAAFTLHDRLCLEGVDPVNAMRQAYWPDLTCEQLRHKADTMFGSPAGKSFWIRWRQSKDTGGRAAALAQFDASLKDAPEVWLQELFFRNMLAPGP
jgi:hypothetical protein